MRPGARSPEADIVNLFISQRDWRVALELSRGSGAVRGSRGPNMEAHGEYRERLYGGHSETERRITSAENCVQADLQHVTLKVYRPVKRVTDGGRLKRSFRPFFDTKEA
jgi:hypothetical protein